jgi:hypothetical protein
MHIEYAPSFLHFQTNILTNKQKLSLGIISIQPNRGGGS